MLSGLEKDTRRRKIYNEARLLGLKGKSSSLYYGEELMEKYPDHFNWVELPRRNLFTLESFSFPASLNFCIHFFEAS